VRDLIPLERIENKIYLIREQKVMLDRDLAELYGVKTFVLNQAVRRNLERFPRDFMFQLTREELKRLRSQFVILENAEEFREKQKSRRGKHAKYLPYAFTEQGLAMLSSVLRSKRAIQVNISIMRAFVRLKRFLFTHKEFARKLKLIEQIVKKHDVELEVVFETIQKMLEPEIKHKKIGFLKEREEQ